MKKIRPFILLMMFVLTPAALAPMALAPMARADEPGFLSKERWAGLSEVQYGELKTAEDLFRAKKYKSAKDAYEKFMTVHTTAEVNSYCQLMMAECVRLGGKPGKARKP